MHRIAIVLLSLGVIFGFGSGFASIARWKHHGGCDRWPDRHASYESRWQHGEAQAPMATPPAAAAPAPAPVVYVVMPQAQAAAPAPIIVQAAAPAAQPTVVTVPSVVAAPTPVVAVPAPATP